MNDMYQKVVSLVLVMLKGEPIPSPELIQKNVDLVLNMYGTGGNSETVDRDRLIRDIESRCEVWRGTASVIEDDTDHAIWLPYEKTRIDWKFWKRYERYLMEEKGFSEQNIITLDDLTDRVLERLENPRRDGSWDRRGMVVGHVQSGKTANYTGLICKAADAGYKLIIVLAGMHKNLRSQTQLRLDEGFLGFDTSQNRAFNHENLRTGVGRLQGEEFITVHSLTSSADTGDFNRKVAIQVGVIPGGSEPVLLVIKKNKSVIQNLIRWATSVRGEKNPDSGKIIVRGIPLLIIDDEADNASVNTTAIPIDENGKPLDDYDVSAINGLIRKLLIHFEKCAYIGYTATPFANIFISPEEETTTHGRDLFPRDFIINLPAPPNYIGPPQLFGTLQSGDKTGDGSEGLDIIKKINDYSGFLPDNHKKDFKPGSIPLSLKEAIKSFIISSAARKARGEQNIHNSMLIHVTRFTAVQRDVARLINDELLYIRRRLEHCNPDDPNSIYKEMERLWKHDYIPKTESVQNQIHDPLIIPVEWEEVSSRLYEEAALIRVKVINGTASDILDYRQHPEGINVIAVGGDKLSRGLTLEGLTVSYYLRASRMYDTLMQMGRWFGYRPGYVDLCRLYTSKELVEWYQHISLASEELRGDFDYMAVMNATPMEFGLRVRTHPDGLIITSVNKMRSGTVMNVSFANSLIETSFFHKDPKIIKNNYDVIEDMLMSMDVPSTRNKRHFQWEDVPAEHILEMLRSFKVHESCKKFSPESLIKYFEKCLEKDELTHWTVILINNTKKKATQYKLAGYDIGLTTRSPDDKLSGQQTYALIKGHIIDPTHEYLDLTTSQINQALHTMKTDTERRRRSDDDPKKPSGPYIRSIRKKERGLLLIYPLDPHTAGIGPETAIPIIGLAFSIPESNSAVKVEYKVNNIYWEQEFADRVI